MRYIYIVLMVYAPFMAHAFTLSQAWDAALNYSAEYAAAQHRRTAEVEREEQARAALLPHISAHASYQRQPPSVSSSKITQGWNVQINQSLFDATRIAQYSQSKLHTQVADAQLDAQRNELLLHVAEDYFGVLLAADSMEAASEEKNVYAEQVKQAKGKFALGTATAADIHEAQAGYDAAHAKEIIAAGEKQIIENRLHDRTGLNGAHIHGFAFDKKIPHYQKRLSQHNIEQWQQLALDNNPEYQIQKLSVESSQLAVEVAKSHYLPKVIASLGYQKNRYTSAYQNMGSKYMGEGLIASVQASIPLFSGGENSSRVRQAQSLYLQEQAQLESLQRKIALAIKQAHTAMTSAYHQMMAYEKLLQSSHLKLKAMKVGQKYGLRHQIEVTQARQQIAEVKHQLAQVRHRYVLAYLTLIKESGQDMKKALD